MKGVKAGLPLSSMGVDGDGWGRGESPEKGILVVLDGRDKAAGGALVSSSVLRDNGYIDASPIRERLLKMKADELRWLVETMDVSAPPRQTKAQLIELVLG